MCLFHFANNYCTEKNNICDQNVFQYNKYKIFTTCFTFRVQQSKTTKQLHQKYFTRLYNINIDHSGIHLSFTMKQTYILLYLVKI